MVAQQNQPVGMNESEAILRKKLGAKHSSPNL